MSARRELHPSDSTAFRQVLGRYPTGVVVVTAMSEDGPIGMAMNSFTSVSLDPPLILFCPAATSTTWPRLRRSGELGVNVLSSAQANAGKAFAGTPDRRFDGTDWRPGHNGAPILDSAAGWLECAISAEYPAGDHTVVIANVHRLGIHDAQTQPLVFFGGRYHALADLALHTGAPAEVGAACAPPS